MVEGPEATKSEDVPTTTKNETSKRRTKEEKLPTKVVIRKLPPNMTEDSFLECISPLFEHDYFYYVQDENPSFGDRSYSRAYINFVNVDDVYTFTVKFDDYVFIDDIGQEYPAIVEYAPFQRIPKNRASRRSDSLCGTIEEDSDYQEFVRQLESEAQDHKTSQITEHYFDLANDENEEKITTTPLIEYLTSRKNEYLKYKEEKKEERRRRDIERKKLKEESRRIKKEKDAHKAKIIEKSKEEKKVNQDSKISEEITSSGVRIRGKSYQEERQRDLARRRLEEKSTKTDDNKENNKNTTAEKPENEGEKSADDSDAVKSHVRTEYKDEDGYKKNHAEKKSFREEDRKSSYHARDKDEKKYSYGVKKREFVGGYDYDAKYNKASKSGGYYYEDYKSRGHSSYQKNAYVSGKYGKGKDYYEEKNSKHYDGSKSRKYEYADYKDKKNHKEGDKKHVVSKTAEQALQSEAKVDKSVKKIDSSKDSEINNASSKSGEISRSSSKDTDNHSGSTSEIESSKSKDGRKEKKENDPRAERRIKNKDRPALEIYRPGMGKFSRQRLERNKSNESKDGD